MCYLPDCQSVAIYHDHYQSSCQPAQASREDQLTALGTVIFESGVLLQIRDINDLAGSEFAWGAGKREGISVGADAYEGH